MADRQERTESSRVFIPQLARRARIEGPGVFLEALHDFQRWKRLSSDLQELVLQGFQPYVDAEFEFIGLKNWSVELVLRARRLQRLRSNSEIARHCRVGVYRHRASQCHFHLVPGDNRPEEVTGAVPVKPFLIAQTPVTESQFRASAKPGDHRPAANLSSEELTAWLERMNLQLPDRAQWLHACRGTTNFDYYWGRYFDPTHTWLRNTLTEPQRMSVELHRVESKWNAFGLIDLVGNVFELLCKEGIERNKAIGLSYRSRWDLPISMPVVVQPLTRDDVGFRPIKTL